MIVGNILNRMSSKGLWWSDILAKTWKKWGMNGTIISGEECSSRGNSEYADPEEKHIWLSQARNQYAHSTLSNSEMIEQCRLYVGLCRP